MDGHVRCPGQDQRYWKPEDIFLMACPACGNEIEFWKDEPVRHCTACRRAVRNPRMDLGCAKWCRSGEACLGQAALHAVSDAPLREKLIVAMEAMFADDRELIDHTLQVLDFAERILAAEGGDPVVVRAAAILHDIGIPEALRKHGAATGMYQEREGPPIADALLAEHEVAAEAAEHVSRIVGSHHSADDIDTREFRIIWDADLLVNLPKQYGDLSVEEIAAIIETTFRTDAGRRIARRLYAPDYECD